MTFSRVVTEEIKVEIWHLKHMRKKSFRFDYISYEEKNLPIAFHLIDLMTIQQIFKWT